MDMTGFILEMPLLSLLQFREDELPMPAEAYCRRPAGASCGDRRFRSPVCLEALLPYHHDAPYAGSRRSHPARGLLVRYSPVLTIDPGDTVRLRTLDADWNLAAVDLTFSLHPDLQLTMPRAHTPAGWITFGLHEDLDEAALLALEGMVDLLCVRYGLERRQALGMASVLVDLRVTQLVNQVKGVHALLPHAAL